MTKILKRPLSVLLAVMMIAGIFAVVPISASAAAVTPKYKITINNKVVANNVTLPYTTSATNLKNKAGYSSYTATSLKVYKAKDNIGTISGMNFTVNKSGSEQLDIGLKKGSTTGHITPTVTCTPLTKCVCEATGYTGYYDGEPHTIEGLTVTSPESGATVKYGTVSGTYNLTEPPTFTEVGTHTVYYQISASGWVTITGSVNVNILRSYTVTWKNWDGTELEKDEYVAKDATPDYNGATPEKASDTYYDYTFSGWSPAIAPVSADVTYTAQFTAVPKLFVGNTITLNADIGVNFFINSAYANFDGAQTATVVFTWDDGNYTKEVNLKALTKESNGCYKATCDVVAAHMAHKIHAVVYLDGTALDETDDFSVQDYAEKLYKNPEKYDTKNRPDELKALAKALLNYGSMAQTVFDGNLHEKPALANTNVGAWSTGDYAAVTAGLVSSKINGSASDLNSVATQLGAKYFTNSLIYLSKNTLRIYFTPTSYPGEIPNADAYDGNLSGYYYYVDHANIKAAELDNQQTFNVNGTEFTFSALDYVVAVIGSNSMSGTQKNLAKSLFLYNQAANAYFDEPAPVENVVDLSTLTGAYEAQDGDVLINALSGNKKITVANGAKITLRNANITSLTNAAYAGITPLGDATILLEGTNVVKGGVSGGYADYPGIFAPAGYTLTIDGTGSLTASKGDDNGLGGGGGIGGGYEKNAGNIEIKGGNVTAIGGYCAAGIGGGNEGSCGNIVINGGNITATGGVAAAGIGSGYEGSCGDITIADTVTSVTATKGEDAPNSIGAGLNGTCGTVTIGGTVYQNGITTSPYTYEPN